MLDPGNPGNNFHKIFIGCPTDHVLLLPRSLFDPHRAEQYLVAANMFSPEKTTLSNSILSPRAVAVWQTDAGITSHLLQLYPSALFYHPLLLDLDATPAHTINVILDSGLIHLVICHHSLHAAETLAASNPEELLYYISRLAPTPDLATYRLRIAGDGASILQPFFLRYFSQVDIHEEQQYNIQRITRLCE